MAEMSAPDLKERAVARLLAAGVRPEDAESVVDHMITADLWGRRSHGLSVRFGYVLRQVRDGAGAARPEISSDEGHRVRVDGHNGLGYAAARFCTEVLIERAKEHGLAAVALMNARHTGMIGYYTDMAARAGIVAMAFANCCPLMAPHGGTRRLLGTNPISFGFPADPRPVLVDMATSAISMGDVIERISTGEELAEGCALDEEGRPTRDPAAARAGALLPFGGHRGGALAVAVQLLAGAFTGSTPIPPPGKDYGLLLLGFSRGVFAGDANYDAAVNEFAAQYAAVPSRGDYEVRLPGSARYTCAQGRDRAVLSVSDEVMEMLRGSEG
jgi:L-2-hydroxycarboxylate dehydrogenase (NAD+)